MILISGNAQSMAACSDGPAIAKAKRHVDDRRDPFYAAGTAN
jgi:hypothetical protein